MLQHNRYDWVSVVIHTEKTFLCAGDILLVVVTGIASPTDFLIFCSWFPGLESTRWLQYLSCLLVAASTVIDNIHCQGRPVLVHCSDGWDRTTQIVCLAKLCLDPYYRTMKVRISVVVLRVSLNLPSQMFVLPFIRASSV